MESGVEKVDSGAGGSQHRGVGRPRQLRACVGLVLVAVLAAAPLPLAAQQEQRVVRGLSFDGNNAIDSYTLSTAIATSNSAFFASVWWLRWIGFLGEKRSFNELEFRRDVVRLLLLYRQSGYMDAVIDTLVRRGGNDRVIRFRVMGGGPLRVGAARDHRVGRHPEPGRAQEGPAARGRRALQPDAVPGVRRHDRRPAQEPRLSLRRRAAEFRRQRRRAPRRGDARGGARAAHAHRGRGDRGHRKGRYGDGAAYAVREAERPVPSGPAVSDAA